MCSASGANLPFASSIDSIEVPLPTGSRTALELRITARRDTRCSPCATALAYVAERLKGSLKRIVAVLVCAMCMCFSFLSSAFVSSFMALSPVTTWPTVFPVEWKVLRVSCVTGSLMLIADTLPTASPADTSALPYCLASCFSSHCICSLPMHLASSNTMFFVRASMTYALVPLLGSSTSSKDSVRSL